MGAGLVRIAAALGYAAASVLQQREAQSVPPGGGGIRLVLRLARRPWWLAGVACDGAAFGLQAVALGVGSLLVVQPVLTSGLLFALPASAWLAGRRLARPDLGFALVLAGRRAR